MKLLNKVSTLFSQKQDQGSTGETKTLVYNGTFDSSVGWTLSTAGQAQITGGQLVYNNPNDQFANSSLYVASILPSTKYRLEVDSMASSTQFIGLKQYNSGTYLSKDSSNVAGQNYVEITTASNCNRLMLYAGVTKAGQYIFDNLKLYKIT